MIGHILDVRKNMVKQQQEIPEKQPKLTEQKAYTKFTPVHRDEFYPPGSKREALQLGVHLILLYFIRISS